MFKFSIVPILALIFLQLGCQRHEGKVLCCKADASATAQFASLANDPNFRNAHTLADVPTLQNSGDNVEFPVAGGPSGHGYFVRPKEPSKKWLLLLHEWWGLNDFVKHEAEYWADTLKINVLAIDLYDSKVAQNAEEAGNLMRDNQVERSQAIIQGAMDFAGPEAEFRTMGWCFGGGWSLQTALLAGKRSRGCVMYYGMPETDVEKLKTLGSDVLFIHANKDQWINAEVVTAFEKNMEAAGQKVHVYHYDAEHAFANPSGPHYNETAAKEARAIVIAYLSRL